MTRVFLFPFQSLPFPKGVRDLRAKFQPHFSSSGYPKFFLISRRLCLKRISREWPSTEIKRWKEYCLIPVNTKHRFTHIGCIIESNQNHFRNFRTARKGVKRAESMRRWYSNPKTSNQRKQLPLKMLVERQLYYQSPEVRRRGLNGNAKAIWGSISWLHVELLRGCWVLMMDQRKGSREHGLGLLKMPHATAACSSWRKVDGRYKWK